jgi:hypothetical protein
MAKQWIIPLTVCILVFSAFGAAQAQTGAVPPKTIEILPDGSITPPSAPIYRSGDIYQLTDNITYEAIIVERNNIVLDGRSFTVQGNGVGNNQAAIYMACTGVTVKNFRLQEWQVGILGVYDNNRIVGNDFTYVNYEIAVYANNYEITQNYLDYVRIVGSNIHVYGNEIQAPDYGSAFWLTNSTNIVIEGNIVKFTDRSTSFISASGGNLSVYHNNFVNADKLQFSQGEFYLFDMSGLNNFEPWDNGYPVGGNYWSDYTARYSNASEIGDSGIWNTSYALAAYFNAPLVDRYPIQNPFPVQVAALPPSPSVGSIEEYPTPSVPELPIWAMIVLFTTIAFSVIALKKATKKHFFLNGGVTSAESL